MIIDLEAQNEGVPNGGAAACMAGACCISMALILGGLGIIPLAVYGLVTEYDDLQDCYLILWWWLLISTLPLN